MARYIVIHNPISGTGRAGRRFETLVSELRSRGHQVEHLRPGSKEESVRFAREADSSCDALISIGGDGTHNSVINGLIGRPVPLLPVPAGTENVLCKAVGIPADHDRIREILEAGRVRSIDIAMANGYAFAVMSGIGFDATVTGEVHQKRRGPISRWWYFWPTFKNFWAYKWPHLDVEVDGQPVAAGAAFLIVGNMRMYADRLEVCARALPDDGLLDVCIFTRPGRWHLLSYFFATRGGHHLDRDDVVYRQGRRIVVRPTESDVPYQVDGDAIGRGAVEYTLHEKALRMIVPTDEGVAP